MALNIYTTRFSTEITSRFAHGAHFRTNLRTVCLFFPKRINQLVFVSEFPCVFLELGTDSFSFSYLNEFGFQMVNVESSDPLRPKASLSSLPFPSLFLLSAFSSILSGIFLHFSLSSPMLLLPFSFISFSFYIVLLFFIPLSCLPPLPSFLYSCSFFSFSYCLFFLCLPSSSIFPPSSLYPQCILPSIVLRSSSTPYILPSPSISFYSSFLSISSVYSSFFYYSSFVSISSFYSSFFLHILILLSPPMLPSYPRLLLHMRSPDSQNCTFNVREACKPSRTIWLHIQTKTLNFHKNLSSTTHLTIEIAVRHSMRE